MLDRAVEVTNKSVSLDDSNANAYAVRGWIEAAKNERDQAIADGKRAVALDPNNAFASQALADIDNLFYRSHEAIQYAERSIRLDPRHPEFYALQFGEAYNAMGRFTDAVNALIKDSPNDLYGHLGLVYAYSELGREKDAQAEAAEVLRVSPGFTLEQLEQTHPTINWRDPIVQKSLADFRKAGLK
jgi:adenylate cyclase